MRDDGATWTAQMQAGLKARQRVNACVQKLDASPDWRQVRTAFVAYFAVLEKLGQKVRAIPDRLQVLPELLQRDVLAFPHWLELEKEEPIELLVDLWNGWASGKLTAQYFSEEMEFQAKLLELYNDTGNCAFSLKYFEMAGQLFHEGIAHGKLFLVAHEKHAGVRRRLLVFYLNAGVCMHLLEDREAEYQILCQGIADGKNFLDDHEIDSRTREMLLQFYSNAGVNRAIRGDGSAADQLYRQGITYGEKFLEDDETFSGVRVQLLWLYFNVGANMSWQKNKVVADKLFCQGIAHGEQFIAAGETHPEVRERLLRLLLNAGINMASMGMQAWLWHYRILFNALEWQWNCIKKDNSMKDMILQTELDFDLIIKLIFWHEILYQFIVKFQNKEVIYSEQDTLTDLIVITEALLLQASAQDNAQFCNLFERWIPLQEQLENQLKDWKNHLKQHHQHLENTVIRLFPKDRPELENLPFLLAEMPWWQRLHHPLAYRRIQRDVQAYQKLLSQPVVNEELRSEIQNYQQLFVDWLVGRWLDYHEILGELEKPGSALLGIVFAAQREESSETALARWQTRPPWADPKDLSAAMTRAGWAKVVLPHDDDAFTLHDWTGRIDQPRLTIAEETLNFAGPALIETLRAYNQGNVEPLQRTLEYAWTQAQEKAPALARLLRRLSSAQETAESCAGSEPPSTEQEVRTALAALVLGDARAVLAKALHDRLEQQWPLQEDTPLEEAQLCLKRRFSTLVSLSPGPRHHRELAERLHAWCQQALHRELAAPAPDVTEIWDTLEHSRVALLGLKVKAPDPAWEEETARQIHAVLQCTPVVPPRPGLIWPPFQCWLDRLTEAGLLPDPPTIADCQHRLRANEALVRLFFDPGSGHLFALWLEPDRAVDLRRFGDATAWPHWRAFDDHDPAIQDRRKRWQLTAGRGELGDDAEPGVLDRWERWLEKQHSGPFPTVFHKVMTSPAVTTVVDNLQDWCQQTDRTRLIILLPAPLAQLPWEVLPPFDSGPITLERAVSLSHWRVTPDEMPQDDQDPQEKTSGPPPLGVFYDNRSGKPDSIILAEWQAQRAGDFWNRAVLGTDDGLTAFDILTHLHRHANGHLLLHGKYRQDDPRRSHFQLRSDEHFYAWTASAIGVRGGLFGLAACQANLSGATTQTLLASVGLGPALIASGAAAVIGPLWSCDQWAALAFFHRLFELARQESQEPWSRLLQRARLDLRQMTKADLLKIFDEKNLAEAKQNYYQLCLEELEANLDDQPFRDNPFYWAPFILLGDDRRTDPHGIDSKTC